MATFSRFLAVMAAVALPGRGSAQTSSCVTAGDGSVAVCVAADGTISSIAPLGRPSSKGAPPMAQRPFRSLLLAGRLR